MCLFRPRSDTGFFYFMDIIFCIFVSMQEIHIKIPKEEFDFMQDFKTTFGVTMQDFIIKSIRDNIKLIKVQHEQQTSTKATQES